MLGFSQYKATDERLQPALEQKSGTGLGYITGGGQITAESTLEDVKNIDFERVNPVTGPVYVEGAEPGDALKVTIMSLKASGWGWSAVIPGFGLLADQFDEPALYIWEYDPQTLAPASYLKGARVPLKPFPGTIGGRLLRPQVFLDTKLRSTS